MGGKKVYVEPIVIFFHGTIFEYCSLRIQRKLTERSSNDLEWIRIQRIENTRTFRPIVAEKLQKNQ